MHRSRSRPPFRPYGVGVVCAMGFILTSCGSDGTATPDPPPPQSSLSCVGYPKSGVMIINDMQQNYTAVCLLLQDYAAVTAGISISTQAGEVLAHGGHPAQTYPVYTRIVAQAADEGTATALAKSVVVTVANGMISASPDHVDFPESLVIDFETFTDSGTNMTMSSAAGNLLAEDYNATLRVTSQAGTTTLNRVQGDVTVDVNAGTVKATLSGAGWAGAGMTVSTQTGTIAVSRPAAYQAAFTAESDDGTVTIDGKSVSTTASGTPATVTSGSGAPILLKATTGEVNVTTAM